MNKKIGYLKKIKRILPFTGEKKLILIVLGALTGSCLELLCVSIIYPFIDLLLSAGMGTKIDMAWLSSISRIIHVDEIWTLVILMIIVYLVKNVYMLLYNRYEINYFIKIQNRLATGLMNIYMNQPYSFFLKENPAVLLRGIQWDAPQFCVALKSMVTIGSHSILAIMLLGLLFVVDIKMTILILLVIGISVFLFYFLFKRKSARYGEQTQQAYKDIYQWSEETVEGIKEIKVLHREDFFLKGFIKIYENFSKANNMFTFMNMFPRLILESVCVATIVLFITLEMKNGQNPVGYIPTLSVFAMVFFRMFPRIGEISTGYNNVIYSKASVEAVYDILMRVDENAEAKDDRKTYDEVSFQKEIRGRDISFRYENSEENILSKVNFSIEKGSAVAFVGTSGAGKTTLINIILGLLQPTEGSLIWDEKDVNMQQVPVWKYVGYIPQNVFIADDTIRNNIIFGAHSYCEDCDEKVWNILEEVKLKTLVSNLPDGLNTVVGKNGIRLSGGERQRLAIARALYQNPQILVMDEATSSLDAETEKAVIETISYLKGKMTLIIIAHRLSTIEKCDYIYRLNDGQLSGELN